MELIIFTVSIWLLNIPQNTEDKIDELFISEALPSNSILTEIIFCSPTLTCPKKLPNNSESLAYGFIMGASSALIEGVFKEFIMDPFNK